MDSQHEDGVHNVNDKDGDDNGSLPDETTNPSLSLLDLLSPIESCKVDRMSGTDLAYIGDSVFELFIRSKCVWPSKRTSDLQNQVVGLVRGMLPKKKDQYRSGLFREAKC